MKKICSKCKIEKSIDCFSKDKTRPDGHRYVCIDCNKQKNKETKEARAVKAKIYNLKNKEILSEAKKKYKEKNKEQILKKAKDYYEKNKKELVKKRHLRYLNNKEKAKQYYDAYRKTEKGKMIDINRKHIKRTAIKNGASCSDVMEIIKKAKNCYWCGVKLEKVHIDHYIPLSKGGKHIINNLVISCPSCNMAKGAKDPYQFANKIGRLL